MLDTLEFLGEDYKKIVEIFRMQTKNIFGISTAKTYFDCTNYYFEIDREDELRKKDPSKENRKSPIVGMGLLLDENSYINVLKRSKLLYNIAKNFRLPMDSKVRYHKKTKFKRKCIENAILLHFLCTRICKIRGYLIIVPSQKLFNLTT